MPIQLPSPITRISQSDFGDIAYDVVGQARDIHAKRGPFFDESIYQLDLQQALTVSGKYHSVETEVRIDVIWESFSKSYYIDLLVNGSALFELKACEKLNSRHEGQVTNYLFLTGLNHSKLINFGSSGLENRFVNANLSLERRQDFLIDDEDWQPKTTRCVEFRQIFQKILRSWGTGLDIKLYEEAMTHFMGGEQNVVQSLPVSSIAHQIPSNITQKARVLDSETAFKITALNDIRTFEKHALKWLHSTPLRQIHWVNITHFEVMFATLSKTSSTR